MVIYTQLLSTLVELYLLLVEVHLLVELLFGGVLSSLSFGFAQWWRFFSYYCCCAHLVRCGGAMGIGIVQFTQQCSSVSKSLTCYAQGPGFDPHDNHPGWQDRPSSTSSIFREEEVKLSSDWLQTQAWSAQWRGDHQDKKHCHHQHKKKKEHSH
mmetsp:Transcript_43653/g.75503  ORF Transcript_43653/g.75503 Transcript_43653/m.75503 type:complete len:154 (-) Transcript_43653:245-706(-)